MTKSELLENLPPVWGGDLVPEIHRLVDESEKTIVVLDDDPTGTQTVYDVPVLTSLDPDDIEAALEEAPRVLFILTNSRALNPAETRLLHERLGNILKSFGEDLVVISRSDSTLRGHFPLEVEVLRDALEISEEPVLFIPFFEGGGRLTVNDRHYVIEGEEAIPAHETPFAQDSDFPFSSSYLPDYVREKYGYDVEVKSISLDELRSGDVTRQLEDLPARCVCVVNAVCREDLDVLSLGLHQSSRRFLYRTAASFVQSFAGVATRPLLESWQLQDLEENSNGGLIVVGSHVPKTTSQLSYLFTQAPEVTRIEVDVELLLNEENPLESGIDPSEEITAGRTVVIYTSRQKIESTDQSILGKVSKALVDLVREIQPRPSFVVAKGGITSSDIATDALGIKNALVLGQISPGVPVWTMGHETRFPGLPYVIFPGNVGDESALLEAYCKLKS